MGNKGSKAKKAAQAAEAAAPAAAAGGSAPAGGSAADIDGLQKITVDDFDLLKVTCCDALTLYVRFITINFDVFHRS